MPTTVEPVRETREMRLFSMALTAKRKGRLSAFLANRRFPGADWRTWEQIAIELHDVTGESVTREGLRHWAIRYGIPTDSPRTPTTDEVDYFRRKLKDAGIEI